MYAVLGTDKKGRPNLVVMFKGDREVHRMILTTAEGIVQANAFLQAMNTGHEIKFESYSQYDQLIRAVFESFKQKKTTAS
jgi:hypothetical protein